MVSSCERHGLLEHRPWKVLLSVSMPNQLMPVSRTVAPVLSMILLPLVWRYPVPVPPVAADAGEAARTAAVSTPAAAVATAAMPPARADGRNTVNSFELQRGRGRGRAGAGTGPG